jgi:hypothetical protein
MPVPLTVTVRGVEASLAATNDAPSATTAARVTNLIRLTLLRRHPQVEDSQTTGLDGGASEGSLCTPTSNGARSARA